MRAFLLVDSPRRFFRHFELRNSAASLSTTAVGVGPSCTTTRYRSVNGEPALIVYGASAAITGLTIHKLRELCHVLGGLDGWSITAAPTTFPLGTLTTYPYHAAGGQLSSGTE